MNSTRYADPETLAEIELLEMRVAHLEHQHKNDEAANRLLHEAYENVRVKLRRLEKSNEQNRV